MSAQIDLLHPDARRVLRYCAVLGRSFRVEVLRRTLATDGLVADAAVLSSLGSFLQPDGPDRWRFRNSLIRDAAYEGLAYKIRSRLHRAAGETLEAMSTDLDADSPTLALHFWRAGDAERTWRYAQMAGELARESYANVDAAAQYERALEVSRRVAGDHGRRARGTVGAAGGPAGADRGPRRVAWRPTVGPPRSRPTRWPGPTTWPGGHACTAGQGPRGRRCALSRGAQAPGPGPGRRGTAGQRPSGLPHGRGPARPGEAARGPGLGRPRGGVGTRDRRLAHADQGAERHGLRRPATWPQRGRRAHTGGPGDQHGARRCAAGVRGPSEPGSAGVLRRPVGGGRRVADDQQPGGHRGRKRLRRRRDRPHLRRHPHPPRAPGRGGGCAAQGLRVLRASGIEGYAAHAQMLQARIHLARGELSTAEELAAGAVAEYTAMGSAVDALEASLVRADVAIADGPTAGCPRDRRRRRTRRHPMRPLPSRRAAR